MTVKPKGSDRPWLKNYKLGPYHLKQTLVPYPLTPVHRFLDDSADAYPTQIAVEYLGRRIRYDELRNYVNSMARALAELGIAKGDRVATVLPNCPQFIITDFAVSKAGGTLVPCSTLHKVRDRDSAASWSPRRRSVCASSLRGGAGRVYGPRMLPC